MDSQSLSEAARAGREPHELTPAQRVLWLDARGEWDAAHDLAQDMGGRDGVLAEEWSSLVERFCS